MKQTSQLLSDYIDSDLINLQLNFSDKTLKNTSGSLIPKNLQALIKFLLSRDRSDSSQDFQGSGGYLVSAPTSINEARIYVRCICTVHGSKPIVVCLDQFNTASSYVQNK